MFIYQAIKLYTLKPLLKPQLYFLTSAEAEAYRDKHHPGLKVKKQLCMASHNERRDRVWYCSVNKTEDWVGIQPKGSTSQHLSAQLIEDIKQHPNTIFVVKGYEEIYYSEMIQGGKLAHLGWREETYSAVDYITEYTKYLCAYKGDLTFVERGHDIKITSAQQLLLEKTNLAVLAKAPQVVDEPEQVAGNNLKQ